MTPAQIEEAARQKYNSVGDTFYSTSEILYWIYQACLELALEAKLIERVYTTTTVAGQQEYDYPTNTIEINRVTYNGTKLQPITMREDDVLTLNLQSSTATGTPQYYYIFNRTLYLRPIPDDTKTLKIFSFNEPQEVTASSTLEIPSLFHMGIVDFVTREMADKDENESRALSLDRRWELTKARARQWVQRRKRGDALAYVRDEETLGESYIGLI